MRVVEAAHKAPGGLIRVTARLRGDVIDDVGLSGDFTLEPGTGLGVLEEALLGCLLESAAVGTAISRAYDRASLRSPGVTPDDVAVAVLRLSATTAIVSSPFSRRRASPTIDDPHTSE